MTSIQLLKVHRKYVRFLLKTFTKNFLVGESGSGLQELRIVFNYGLIIASVHAGAMASALVHYSKIRQTEFSEFF